MYVSLSLCVYIYIYIFGVRDFGRAVQIPVEAERAIQSFRVRRVPALRFAGFSLSYSIV